MQSPPPGFGQPLAININSAARGLERLLRRDRNVLTVPVTDVPGIPDVESVAIPRRTCSAIAELTARPRDETRRRLENEVATAILAFVAIADRAEKIAATAVLSDVTGRIEAEVSRK